VRERRPADIVVEAPTSEQAGAIAEVIRAGFDEDVVDLTIYGSPSIGNWIAAQLDVPADMAERVYLGAYDAGRMIGCIELSPHPESLFISYVSVVPDRRRQSIGSQLLASAVRARPHERPERIALDVLASNEPALAWYRSLGFSYTRTDVLCDASAMLPAGEAAGRVSQLPAAVAAHEAFGFSEFQVETRSGQTRVGRLGDRWWRLALEDVDGPSPTDDRDLLATLTALDPRRGLLLSVTGGPSPVGAKELLTTHRLESNLTELVGRLT
jgi:ribosomal protein S18 acetylase RimI-like enzyme